jgi:hypothetical protein
MTMTTRVRAVRTTVAVAGVVVSLAVVASAQQVTRRLFVAVTNAQGLPVLDLQPSEFTVVENGRNVEVRQVRLSRDPMRIALLVDSSEAIAPFLIDMRAGLQAFINAIPEEHEIVFLSIGRQTRVRAREDVSRTRLRQLGAEFASDGGRTTLLDGLREADERFMRRFEESRWPVYVILTTDGPEGSGSIHRDQYTQLVQGMLLRGAVAHAVVIQLNESVRGELAAIQPRRQVTPGQPFDSTVPERTPDAGEIALNITGNLRGSRAMVTLPVTLPEILRELGRRLVADHRAMSLRYEIEYRGSADLAVGAMATVSREGVQVESSLRRPF